MAKKEYVPPTIERNVSGLMNKHGQGSSVQSCPRIGGVDVGDLVAAHGSPLFVFDETDLRDKYRKAKRAFSKRYPKVQFAWSYKTNYLNAVCRVFHEEGAMAEVVSGFEYAKARALGVPGNRIIFNGPYKSRDDLRVAASEEARIHIDNLDELLTLEGLAEELGRPIPVAIRVNMDTGIRPLWTKFGFNVENGEAFRAAKRICTNGKLQLVGLHTHIGTFILEAAAYGVAVEKLLALGARIHEAFQTRIEYLDLGGGFASRNTLYSQYLPAEHVVPSMDQYAEAICDALHNGTPPGMDLPTLYLETGRALVDEAGYLVSSTVAIKKTPAGQQAIVLDVGVNLLYTSAWYKHRVLPVREAPGPTSRTTVYGCLCMNIDVIRDDAPLPAMEVGDRVVIHPVGAYNVTQAMQFITYRPAVLLVGAKGEVDVIRKREDLRYVSELESVPARLQ